jgi:hypothetical protein
MPPLNATVFVTVSIPGRADATIDIVHASTLPCDPEFKAEAGTVMLEAATGIT